MTSEEKRLGRKNGDDDIQCEVRGGFGGARDKAEDLIPDSDTPTRGGSSWTSW